MYFRAEKDYSQRVRDNSVANVGGLSVENVDKDLWEFVGHTRTTKVAKDYVIDVGYERNKGGMFNHLALGEDDLQQNIFGYDSLGFDAGTTGDYRVTVKGTINFLTENTYSVVAEDAVSMRSETDSVTIYAPIDVDVTGDKHVDITAGTSFTASAGSVAKMEVAGNSITVSKDGSVRIRAKNIFLDAENNVNITAGAKIKLKASKIDMN